MTITAERLEKLGACQQQIDQFRALWDEGPAPMTIEAAVENANAFNWEWAACRFLAAPARAEYKRAEAAVLAEFERAIAPARAEFERATAAVLAECERAEVASWAEYKRAEASAQAEYERAMAPAWAEYLRAIARAFATLYIEQEAAA